MTLKQVEAKTMLPQWKKEYQKLMWNNTKVHVILFVSKLISLISYDLFLSSKILVKSQLKLNTMAFHLIWLKINVDGSQRNDSEVEEDIGVVDREEDHDILKNEESSHEIIKGEESSGLHKKNIVDFKV